MPQLSLLPSSTCSAVIDPFPDESSSTVMSVAVAVAVGGSLSLTVTVKLQLALFSESSVTVNVSIVVPIGNSEPLPRLESAGTAVITPEQLSLPLGAI